MSKQLIRNFFIFLIWLIPELSGISLFANNSSDAATTQISSRLPAPRFAESYRLQKEFVYVRPPVKTNFLSQFIDYFRKKYKNLETFIDRMPVVFRLMLWGAAVFCLVIIVVKTRLYRVFYSDKKVESPVYPFQPGEQHIENFDKEIEIQVENRQYRMAVRLLFLKLIDLLKQKELIHFSKNKTNLDYFNDLKSEDFKTMFLKLTHIFNHVWYGDHEITQEQFLVLNDRFQTFYTAIDVQE